MIEHLPNAFQQLVEIFKQNLGISLLVAILLIVGIIGYNVSVNTQIVSQLQSTPERGALHFEQALESSSLVNDTLKDIQHVTGGSYVLIRQFHNGKQDLTGLPFMYSATSHVAAQEGISVETSMYDSVPLSTQSRTLGVMWSDLKNPSCLSFRTEEIPDSILRANTKRQGISAVLQCPLVNPLNYPIGYVAVWYKGNPIDEQLEIDRMYLDAKSAKLVGYLQPPEKDQDQSWLPW